MGGVGTVLQQQLRERNEKMLRNNPTDTKFSKEGAEGCASDAATEIPLRCRPCWSSYQHCSLRRTPHGSRWIQPEGGCSPWRTPAAVGSCRELQPIERNAHRSRRSGRSCHLWGPILEQSILKDGPHVMGPHWKSF